MARPRNYAAEYAARQLRARAEGWSGYSEKRKAVAEAQKYAPGRSREAVRQREAIAVAARDYQPGSMTRDQIRDTWFQDVGEDFFDDDGGWWDVLDDLSGEPG